MKKNFEKYIVLFFSVIIFGGLLWGIIGLGQLLGKNWNIINLLLNSIPRIEGLIYIFIGLCTLTKAIYNMVWEKPEYPLHIILIIFIVVAAGLYWGMIGTGLMFNVNLNFIDRIPNTTIIGIINYTIGIFALIKLFNFIFDKKDKITKQKES